LGGGEVDRGDGGAGEDDRRYSFLDHWNVEAYSTNYLRTVMSVQCLLDGLMGGGGGGRRRQRRVYAGGGLGRYYRDSGLRGMGEREREAHAGRPIWTTEEDMTEGRDYDDDEDDDGKGGDRNNRRRRRRIRIQVRDREIDTLNAFDKHPRLMQCLVRDVIATERFQR
jgi:hypothetical protein